LFVREKMIRELVVFHFQERDRPLREFIKEVVDAAEFLQYRASEREIVDRILMNLHPDILVQAAFLPRPGSYRELRDMVGLIEKRMTVWQSASARTRVQVVLRWWKKVIYQIISPVERCWGQAVQ
jgi:hypothetical protein